MADVGQPQPVPQIPSAPPGPLSGPQPLGPLLPNMPPFPIPRPMWPQGPCRPGFGDYWIGMPGQPMAADVRGLNVGFSESDRRTLARVLIDFKTARADTRNKDAKKARDAWFRLLTLACYLSGFLDGKRMSINSGFSTIVDSFAAESSPDKQLDEFQRTLEKVVAETRTGGLTVPGLIIAGIGVVMRVAGEAIKEK